ncbi:hypothetical protein PIGHUM_04008 [Pigmentiphaga humi]|uniref:Type II toxin-antitoxin system RelE/ParE family toxin n=1 Tax=Pigmentiphaga humi TaxID=2478468 RepID=A0A3P4B6K3_9BURK|nr:type II toxin-antitoxin system RelE/ParE family toxin [Pigmentiphaga humi]VCU71917.1 hypothetical protein PIGHUM_04008 [Pigmentiphaga humi]
MAWKVVLLPQAEAELSALPKDMQARFLHIAELLEAFGPQRVGMPHIRPIQGKLWEIRMTGRDGIARALYVAMSGRRLQVLHVFVKKTEKTPPQAIETALGRLKEAT